MSASVITLTNETAQACLEKAAEFERKSEYELALKALSPVWSDIRKKPSIRSLSTEVAGVALLRCGSILSKLASNYQIAEQERAQDFLTEAIDIFSRCNNFARIVEGCNLLAWSCLRLGRLAEAKAYLEISLEQPISQTSIWRIQAHNHLAFVHLYEDNHEEAYQVLKKIEPVAEKCDNAYILARYHNQFALVLMKLGENERALRHFELSKHYLEITGNKKYQGLIENNLAWLFLAKKDYQSAHLHANEALKIYRQAKDVGREGDTLETKAQLFLAESKYSEAFAVIDKAIELLLKADSYGDLLKSYLTKCIILLSLGKQVEALGIFAVAHELAATKIGEEKAIEISRLFRDYFLSAQKNPKPEPSSAQVNEKDSQNTNEIKDVCRVELPEEINPHADHVILRVENDYFDSYKISEGTLLLVERCVEIPDNSFAVLRDKDDCYYIGFVVYHRDLKLYQLGFCGDKDPLPLEDAEVTAFGRVVAFCPPDEIGGEIRMRPLRFS